MSDLAPAPSAKTPGAHVVAETEEKITVFSPGKINLYLRVGPVIPEFAPPRHQLLTVFQCLDLGDTLTFSRLPLMPGVSGRQKTPPDADQLKTSFAPGLASVPNLDVPGNLVCKTLQLLRKNSDTRIPALRIEVRKRIPVAGGMAGGSADAAGVIVGVNRLCQLDLSRSQQLEIATQLGADVAALLTGGNCAGTRFGDILTPLPSSIKRYWVLAISAKGLSTPEVFREFDRENSPIAPLPEKLPAQFVQALEASPKHLAAQLTNDLEEPALALYPQLRKVKQAAMRAGALETIISGSGPTVACLCENEKAAEETCAVLRNNPLVKLAVKATGPYL